jgi:hypothetical protein
MPSLTKHHSAQTTKLLFVGDSGSGKTGALASLAAAGYNLRILDLDNGMDVLYDLLTSDKSRYDRASAERVHYITVTERMKNAGGTVMPLKASVWQRAMSLMMDWKDEEQSLGAITSWTPKEVLVIDSLTMLSDAALAYILQLNGRLGKQPYESDWGHAQGLIENFMRMLYDESVVCNVIINCHMKVIGGENESPKWYPNTLGKALPPKLGRYFNTVLMAQARGQGNAVKRQIFTQSQGTVELKSSVPTKVAASYPLESGLADYFAAVRS